MRRSRFFLLFFLFVTLIAPLIPYSAHADGSHDLSVAPAVIDEKAKVRDILKETVTITNTSGRKLTLYPSVNDVLSQDGEQPFQEAQGSDALSHSLSNWIELSRGVVEISPGEEKTVPFVIRVNPNAIPNLYHSVITFSEGNTRDAATARPPLGTATVNLEVQADIKEIMQLNAFTTDNIVFTGDDVLFKYQVQNIGNQELQPKGEIRIYNRKGEEVASLDVNDQGKVVSPDQVAQLASVWSAVSGFGKYKALLDVDYGKSQVASVHDTIYFWVIPWKQLLGASIATLLAIIFLALYFHRWLEERHLGKLATAGFIKAEALLHLQSTPPPPLIPVPESVGRMKSSVQETIQEKKTTFDRFKRQGFTPESVTNTLPSKPVPVVERPVAHGAHAGTIDLKSMWNQQKEEGAPIITANHVINLKK